VSTFEGERRGQESSLEKIPEQEKERERDVPKKMSQLREENI
jgi:hypothetical protein